MLELKNVSVWQVLGLDRHIRQIIIENNIENVQELIDIMPKYPNVDWSRIDRDLEYAKHCVEHAQKKGKEPVIYECKPYEDESLKYNDELNKGNILLLSTPTSEFSVTFNTIRYLSIADIKKFLGMTDYNGNNFLIHRARNIGPSHIQGIINAVNMYTEQVERQSQLTESREKNIFTYQHEEKKEIVEDKYAEIIAYLVYNTKEFVWNELSDIQKRMYLSSIVNNRQIEKIIKRRMINIVADYTTLPELESVQKGDYKVLKRFIKR